MFLEEEHRRVDLTDFKPDDTGGCVRAGSTGEEALDRIEESAIDRDVVALRNALTEIYGEGWENKRGTLVVVDDMPGERAWVDLTLTEELKALGIVSSVKSFDAANKALTWLRDQQNRETVLLTVSDRQMPRVSGESFAFNLRAEIRETLIPFMMLTGSIPATELLKRDFDGHTGAGLKVDTLVDDGYIDAVARKPLPLEDPGQIVRLVLWTVMKRLDEVNMGRERL